MVDALQNRGNPNSALKALLYWTRRDLVFTISVIFFLSITKTDAFPLQPAENNDPLIFISNPVEANFPSHWVPLSIFKQILNQRINKRPQTIMRTTRKRVQLNEEVSTKTISTTKAVAIIRPTKPETNISTQNTVTTKRPTEPENIKTTENTNTTGPTAPETPKTGLKKHIKEANTTEKTTEKTTKKTTEKTTKKTTEKTTKKTNKKKSTTKKTKKKTSITSITTEWPDSDLENSLNGG